VKNKIIFYIFAIQLINITGLSLTFDATQREGQGNHASLFSHVHKCKQENVLHLTPTSRLFVC